MPVQKTYTYPGGQTSEDYIYTADEERLAVRRNGWYNWSVRDLEGHILRQYKSSVATPTATAYWIEDFVWRDGLLLGSERPPEMGGRRHVHLDHLGSPRLITSDTGLLVSSHDYYPFGAEAGLVYQEVPSGFDREEPLKFTGHERDFAGGPGGEDGNAVDYMHARYYSPTVGRFFSADPILGNLLRPQSWNRYAYVLNSPVDFMDPSGLKKVEPGKKLEPGDTCNGTVVDGWCTGETITVTAQSEPIVHPPLSWANIQPIDLSALTGAKQGRDRAKPGDLEHELQWIAHVEHCFEGTIAVSRRRWRDRSGRSGHSRRPNFN